MTESRAPIESRPDAALIAQSFLDGQMADNSLYTFRIEGDHIKVWPRHMDEEGNFVPDEPVDLVSWLDAELVAEVESDVPEGFVDTVSRTITEKLFEIRREHDSL